VSVATLSNIEKIFGARVIFDRLNLNIEQGERVGLIGPNGSGKTTLFKVLTGEVVPDAGTVAISRGTKVGHLSQDPTFDADLRLESGQPMDDKAIDEARKRGLAVARGTGLFSVVFNGDFNQLTSLRAVSAGYPLRGKVMLSDEPFGTPELAKGIPARGEVWPDSRLAAAFR
jgi:ATPase subunit of ABC transporter with duplicated ATPase domains